MVCHEEAGDPWRSLTSSWLAKNGTKSIRTLQREYIKIIDCPSNSPNFNPIENIWEKIKIKLCWQEFDNINKLRKREEKEWDSLTKKSADLFEYHE